MAACRTDWRWKNQMHENILSLSGGRFASSERKRALCGRVRKFTARAALRQFPVRVARSMPTTQGQKGFAQCPLWWRDAQFQTAPGDPSHDRPGTSPHRPGVRRGGRIGFTDRGKSPHVCGNRGDSARRVAGPARAARNWTGTEIAIPRAYARRQPRPDRRSGGFAIDGNDLTVGLSGGSR
jgi:hypothetical protein